MRTGTNQDTSLPGWTDISTGSQMYVRFTSDWSVQTTGFEATVQCPDGPLAACEPCEVGKFDHDAGSRGASVTACDSCPSGSFGNATGLTACFACPDGFTSRPGSVSANDCSIPTCDAGAISLVTLSGTADPCVSTTHVTDGASIGFSTGYGRDSVCSWRVACESGPALVHFESFATEADWDCELRQHCLSRAHTA